MSLSFGRAKQCFLSARTRCCGLFALACFLFFGVASHAAASNNPRQVIIDTDPGTDDAIAILLALNSPELNVRALTVVPGNVTAAQGLENALKLVSLANRCDIAVAGGAQHPLFQKLITAEFWHGKNGLANVELPAPKCKADARFGPDLIIQMVHAAPHEITLVPIGPETNIALAVLKDPSIVPLVKEVIVMGGSISGGNVNAAAEANIYNDPEAAQIVFQAGWPLTMAGLDVGNATLFTRRHVEQLAKTHGPQNDFMVAVTRFLVELSEKYGFAGSPMYDPLAAGAAIDSTILKTQAMHVDVETRGEFCAARRWRIARMKWSATCFTATATSSKVWTKSRRTSRSPPAWTRNGSSSFSFHGCRESRGARFSRPQFCHLRARYEWGE